MIVDKSEWFWYTKSTKQRRLLASASPPAIGKEVNIACFRLPLGQFVVARMPVLVSAFCDFGMEVL